MVGVYGEPIGASSTKVHYIDCGDPNCMKTTAFDLVYGMNFVIVVTRGP